MYITRTMDARLILDPSLVGERGGESERLQDMITWLSGRVNEWMSDWMTKQKRCWDEILKTRKLVSRRLFHVMKRANGRYITLPPKLLVLIRLNKSYSSQQCKLLTEESWTNIFWYLISRSTWFGKVTKFFIQHSFELEKKPKKSNNTRIKG